MHDKFSKHPSFESKVLCLVLRQTKSKPNIEVSSWPIRLRNYFVLFSGGGKIMGPPPRKS